MFDVNVKLVAELKEFVSLIASDESLFNFFRSSSKDFTRNRKLPFDKLVLFIARLCKKTLSVELEQFFSETGRFDSCSVSAFVQQRTKLNGSFFACWSSFLCKVWYECNASALRRWKGYRIVAADGSNVTLVNTPQLSKHFGGQRNQTGHFTVGKTFYYYDVLNELILLPRIGPYRCGELNMVYDMVDKTEEDMLLIYDRNFSNYKILALHLWQERERKFVIRAKDSLSIIKKFKQSGKTSIVVDWPPTMNAIEGLHKSGYIINKHTCLKVRLVRVELPGSVEVLITNLWQEEGHDVSVFKDLYFLRWRVETSIALQKNTMQLESFSGLTVTAVEQDFYATVFVANLHSALAQRAQQKVETTVINRKYPMKINKNKSFGKLKLCLVNLFVTNEPEVILKILEDSFINELIPVRKGRSYPRIRKNPHTKSKFKTFTNFKPTY